MCCILDGVGAADRTCGLSFLDVEEMFGFEFSLFF